MNLPSIKTLDRAFPGKGAILRKLLESSAAVRAHPAAVALDRECYNPPSLAELRLTALDAEAGTYGVEAVWHEGEGPNACIGSPAFEYLNVGDMYTATIIRSGTGRYFVGDIGSIIERGNYE